MNSINFHLTSPKELEASARSNLLNRPVRIDRFDRTRSKWKHTRISAHGRVILIARAMTTMPGQWSIVVLSKFEVQFNLEISRLQEATKQQSGDDQPKEKALLTRWTVSERRSQTDRTIERIKRIERIKLNLKLNRLAIWVGWKDEREIEKDKRQTKTVIRAI